MEHIKILLSTHISNKCVELIQDKMKNTFYYIRVLSDKVDGVWQRTEKPCETGSYKYALRRFKKLKGENGFSMLTNLPEYITNVSAACKFLTELHLNNEAYHPEDDANDILWANKYDEPTRQEKKQLNQLMANIYNLPDFEPDFDPCEFLNALHNENMEELMKCLRFEHTNTGGQCTAYVKQGEEGKETYITVQGDVAAPEKMTDAIDVGTYIDGEPTDEMQHYKNIYEYIQAQ